MRNLIAVLLFLITLLVIFIAFIVTIATSKEGIAFSDWLIFLSIILAFSLIITLWWVFWAKWPTVLVKILAVISIVLTILPLSVVLLICGSLIYERVNGALLVKRVAITHYQDTLIQWPWMNYPVGIKVQFEVPTNSLAHNRARYQDPVIWMGPKEAFPPSPYGIYSYPNDSQSRYAILRRNLFDKQNPTMSQQLENLGDTTKITAYLYPGVIEYFESPNAFCTTSGENAYSLTPNIFAEGGNLNVNLFWQYHTRYEDMSSDFKYLLNKASLLENNVDLWTNMHTQFEDSNLYNKGYHACTLGPRKHCFCK